MYELLTGPLLWASVLICLGGLIFRVVWYFKGLSWQLDRVAYTAYPTYGMKGALRSILFWLVPFGNHGWRAKPWFTIMFFCFHVGLVAVPLFLAGHVVLLREGLGIGWWPSMPMPVADFLTLLMLAAAALIAVRRIALPEVRIITTLYDYVLLLITVAPFVTGYLAVHQAENYQFWLLAHIVCGEIMLVAIPFTKLYHVVGFFLSRAQLGMDFGIKRGGKKKNFAW
jgi:nitrate reductase gamma subunit